MLFGGNRTSTSRALGVPFVRQAYMRQNASAVVEWGKLEAVLAVFQKLLSSKANETYAFQLMGTIVMNVSDFF